MYIEVIAHISGKKQTLSEINFSQLSSIERVLLRGPICAVVYVG